MPSTTRSWIPGRKTIAVLSGALALALLVAVFDWDWLRGPLVRYLSDRSQRTVQLAHLDVSFDELLRPTVQLRGLHVDNAPWSGPQPLLAAGRVSFRVSLDAALHYQWVVSELVLEDADAKLEIAADGRRNWRLREPESRGPDRLRILDLEARRSRIRFIDAGRELDVRFDAQPLASPGEAKLSAAARPPEGGAPSHEEVLAQQPEDRLMSDEPLVTHVEFQGRYRDRSFAGQVDTSRSVSFRDTDRYFALKGWFQSGKTRVEAEGMAADVLHSSAARGHLALRGTSLADLRPFVDAPFPASRPYAIEAELTKEKTEYTFARVRAHIGETDLRGELTYEPQRPRALLKATLRSKVGHLSDLGSLVGIDGADARKAPPGRDGASAATAARVFTASPWKTERLRRLDAELDFTVERLVAPRLPALQSLRFESHLSDGVLELSPFELGLADGRASGKLLLDVRSKPASATADLALRGARIEKLLPALPAEKRIAGLLDGELRLEGTGDSLAALMDHAAGQLEARLRQGSIASWLEARMALDGGKILHAVVAGKAPIAIRCAAVEFEISDGRGRSRVLALDTTRTQLSGIGTIDLRKERFELLLTPQPKESGALALRKSIEARGSFHEFDASIVDRQPEAAGGRCAQAAG